MIEFGDGGELLYLRAAALYNLTFAPGTHGATLAGRKIDQEKLITVISNLMPLTCVTIFLTLLGSLSHVDLFHSS